MDAHSFIYGIDRADLAESRVFGHLLIKSHYEGNEAQRVKYIRLVR
jgi:hypothetical protein